MEIEINDKTKFAHIMKYANCETRLQKNGSKLIYFKVKLNNVWHTLTHGNIISIDTKYDIEIIK